ncbi:uncharacterized protein LOC118488140 [Helianthus annuus]|uniref:uncharacterized protein LOC118488140 n=1 Tax=Helianthus annuus TaxID=4232 RepID=UPI001653041A|nr:uncharacterized protein LOC118488140 [Helianthus annuus]
MITSSENYNSICDNFLSRYQHEDSPLGLTGNPHQHHGFIKHRFWIPNIFVPHNPGAISTWTRAWKGNGSKVNTEAMNELGHTRFIRISSTTNEEKRTWIELIARIVRERTVT